MPPTREERRQQRLRGAASHKIQNVDFGLTFKAPAPKTPATRGKSTPRPATNPQDNPPPSRHTPASRGRRRAPNSNSVKQHGSASSAAEIQRSGSLAARESATPNLPSSTKTKLKKRTVNIKQEERLVPLAEEPSQSVDHDMLVEELLGESSELVDSTRLPKSHRRRTVKIVEEVAESPKHAPGSGQRFSSQDNDPPSSGTRARTAIQQIAAPDAVKTPVPLKKRPGFRKKAEQPRNLSSHSPNAAVDIDDVDELSPDQYRDNGEQFSEVEEEVEEEGQEGEIAEHDNSSRRPQRHKQTTVGIVLSQEESEDGEFEEEPESVEEESENYQSETIQLRKTRGRKRKPPQDEEDTEPQAPQPNKRRRRREQQVSPAVQKQPDRRKSKKTRERSEQEPSKSGDIFQIRVHRLTSRNPREDDDTDADILVGDIPFAKRSGVNAVDVLAQFCEEVIDTDLENFLQGARNAEDRKTAKEYTTKLRAVEAFQEELRAKLLELTINLDDNHALGKRVRSSQAEIKNLRTELLRLRAEREQVALETDAVRVRHEQKSTEIEQQHTLNRSIHDIELALSHCKALPVVDGPPTPAPPDLSTLLESIGIMASTKAPGGGMLAQVKSFNAFLEQAALALEGKRHII